MDPPAPPPDQVRGTQVGGGEIPIFLSFEHSEQSPSKGVKNTDQNASLTKRKNGSVRLNYSTKTDIKYVFVVSALKICSFRKGQQKDVDWSEHQECCFRCLRRWIIAIKQVLCNNVTWLTDIVCVHIYMGI